MLASKVNPLLAAIVVLVLFTGARWYAGSKDFSWFVVAGTKHCTSAQIITQPGSGYDGQFFYRYALTPFSTQNPYKQVLVDGPAYRQQRIFYPVLVWLFSFGNPQFVPFVLVLINLLAFAFTVFGLKKLFLLWKLPPQFAFIALLVPGLWMSFARDLGEVLEACLFVFVVLSFEQKRKFLFAIFATAMVFTREPSAMVLFAFELLLLFELIGKKENIKHTLIWGVCAAVPVFLFIIYRYFLFNIYDEQAAAGTDDFNLMPLQGLVEGVAMQWHKTQNAGITGWFEMAFYFGNMGLIVFVFLNSLQTLAAYKKLLLPAQKWMLLIVVIWAIISLFFSHKIWEDDWGFARILSIPVLAGLILIVRQKQVGKLFQVGAGVFILLTLARLIVKV